MTLIFNISSFIFPLICFALALLFAESKTCWILYAIGIAIGAYQLINKFNAADNAINSYFRRVENNMAEEQLVVFLVLLGIELAAIITIKLIKKHK